MVAASRRAGAEADLFPEFVVLERLGEASRNRFQFDFPDIFPRPFEEPDLFLAEGEDIEPVIASEERQERFDMKMVGDDDEFAEGLGKAEAAEEIGGDEERQTVALPPPEEDISRQRLRRFQEGLDLLGAQTSGQQLFFRAAQQVSQPDLVLLTLRAGAKGGHKNRNA